MYEQLHPIDRALVVRDRIEDLHRTASELHAARQTGYARAGERVGLFMRTRWSLGRHLISIGSAVAGGHA